MTQSQPYFLSLVPDQEFTATVNHYKQQVADMVGDQLYLQDPPHLTVYLSEFNDAQSLSHSVGNLAKHLQPVSVSIMGWHVFDNDVLNGNQTLVCQMEEQGCEDLRDIQRQVVEALSPLRNSDSAKRYEASWDRLSAVEQANVQNYGFPFIGPGWIPHISIASIRPECWPEVWSKLKSSPPAGEVHFQALDLYRLESNVPHLVAGYSLSGQNGEKQEDEQF